jgi:hypothetical protein
MMSLSGTKHAPSHPEGETTSWFSRTGLFDNSYKNVKVFGVFIICHRSMPHLKICLHSDDANIQALTRSSSRQNKGQEITAL